MSGESAIGLPTTGLSLSLLSLLSLSFLFVVLATTAAATAAATTSGKAFVPAGSGDRRETERKERRGTE